MPLLGRLMKISESFLQAKNWSVVKNLSLTTKVSIPSPPKRPLTAYMIFCKENRQQILQENPSLSVTDQIKVLAEKWGQLSRDMKEPYEVNARKSTLLYGEEHKKFYENLSEEQKEELSKLKLEKKQSRRLLRIKRALKESGMPKPASTAYSLFVQSQAKTVDIKQPHQFMREVAERWRDLSKEDKKKFEAEAQKDKEKYNMEMKKWEEKLIKEGKSNLINEYAELKGKGRVIDDLAPAPVKQKKETASKKKIATDADISVSKN